MLLDRIGLIYRKSGQFKKAIDYFQQSLTICKEIGDFQGIARSLNYIGSVYDILGEYNKAIEYYQQSVAVFKKIGDHKGIKRSLNNINNIALNISYQGNDKYVKDEYQQAIYLFQEALTIYEVTKDREGVANSLINIGNVYHSLGKYSKALDYFQQSFVIFEEIGHYDIFGSLIGIGMTYYSLGEYSKALDYFQQSLSISKEIDNSFKISTSLINIGTVYETLGEYDKALYYYQKSLSLIKQYSLLLRSVTLSSIGSVYTKLGEYNKALDYYQYSLVIDKQESYRSNIASSLNNLGNVHENLGEYSKAIDFYQKSLAISKEIGDRSGEALVYNNIAELLEKQNKATTAIVFYKESVNVYEQIRQNIQELPPKQQKSYLATVESTYRNLADLLLTQGRILEAQQVLELLKIQEISNYTRSGEVNQDGEQTIATNKPETNVLKTHGTLIALGHKIDDCETKKDCDDNTYSKLLDDQEIISSQFEQLVDQLEEQIQQRRANDSNFLDPNQITATSAKIVEAQPNTVLIYPLVLEDKVWILWASAGGITSSIEVNTVGQKQLSENVLKLRELLKTPQSDLKELQTTAKQLYDWLIPPQLAKELQDNQIKNLVFSLDNVTRYIPMEVLFDGSDYLVNNYTISNIISAGTVDYDETLPSSPSILAGGLSEAVEGFNPLPNVKLELDNIVLHSPEDKSGIFPGLPLLNQQFTQKSMRDHLFEHNILHIATHGEFVPGDNNKSYLMLGDGEKYPIPEIKNLRGLDKINLVVLSACETALGGKGTDGTEITGISSFFLQKGVDTVVASLWKVEDESTSLLMQYFYRNLAEGMGKAKALRQAKLELINQGNSNIKSDKQRASIEVNYKGERKKNFSPNNLQHPYYWGAFILIGNGL